MGAFSSDTLRALDDPFVEMHQTTRQAINIHADAWIEQLRKYARHLPTCALMMTFGADPCSCGLVAIWPKD